MNDYMEDRMRIRIILVLLSSFCMLSAEYCAGEQVSAADQDISHDVCAGFEDYEAGDMFKLSDYNGELNGGNYHIILIDMSASW